MRLELSVLVEQLPERAGSAAAAIYRVRPLLGVAPVVESPDLSLALAQLVDGARERLLPLARQADQRALAEQLLAPPLETHFLDLDIDLRRRQRRVAVLLVAFPGAAGRVVLAPSLPGCGFVARRGAPLAAQAREHLSRHLRKLEQRGDPAPGRPAGDIDLPVAAWVTRVDLELDTGAARDGGLLRRGLEELEKAGVPLHRLAARRGEPVVARRQEQAELEAALAARPPRPVLLLGPAQAGKTALVHGLAATGGAGVWQLVPGRLIAGMSSVGQWEERLLAILEAASRQELVLHVEDLIGLWRAGMSRQSSGGMGMVLRDFLQSRPLRLVAECTPDGLAVLRELDPVLAGAFQLLRVAEPDERSARAMVVAAARHLEDRHQVVFTPAALRTAIELSARFLPEAARPGRTVTVLRELARRGEGERIDEDGLRTWFGERTGLPPAFLDDRVPLDRDQVIATIEEEVVGQRLAVAAVTDALLVAKAGLAAPGRPWASLLFAGPTGVGKTHLAKVLARVLYGSADRLLRFDMNELSDPGAAARLAGLRTGGRSLAARAGAGLLTGAILRQPFSLVLLDEVEKAHKDVLDLLLQVLGEGRLSDGWGRTAGFTSALVILTTNLGAYGAGSRSGFGDRATVGAASGEPFSRAAEAFFRPELFNRIDRVVAFAPLTPADLRRIASKQVAQVLARPGLQRRSSIVFVHPEVPTRVVAAGVDAELGARALRRAVETRVVQPLAAELAGLPPHRPTLIELLPADDPTGIEVRAATLEPAPRSPASRWVAEALLPAGLEPCRAELARIESELEARRPLGAVDSASLDDAQLAYFAAREQVRRVAAIVDRLSAESAPAPRRASGRGRPSRAPRAPEARPFFLLSPAESAELWEQLARSTAPAQVLRDAAAQRELSPPRRGETLQDLLHELCLLRHTVAPVPAGASRVTLGLRAAGGVPAAELERLLSLYSRTLAALLGLEVEPVPAADGMTLQVTIAGRGAWTLQHERGWQMWVGDDGRPALVEIQVSGASDPGPGEVVTVTRVLCAGGPGFDLVSGLLTRGALSPRGLRALLLARHVTAPPGGSADG